MSISRHMPHACSPWLTWQALWKVIQQVVSTGETDVTLSSTTPGAVMRSQRLLHVPIGASVTREQLVGPTDVSESVNE